MRVELTVSGGVGFFPGLKKPTVIDTKELSAEDAAELLRVVEAARFFDQPAHPENSKPRPDAKTYVLTIDDGTRSHTITRSDPVSDADLAALLTFVRKRGSRRG